MENTQHLYILDFAQCSERLRSAGLKRTPARISILRTLSGGYRLLSIDEIYQALSKQAGRTPDRATLYRSIQKMEEAGLVRSVNLGDGQLRYELDGPEVKHHHLVCRDCGRVEPVYVALPEDSFEGVSAKGYTGVTHQLEFFGVCPRCQH